jgi:hypothetical protein
MASVSTGEALVPMEPALSEPPITLMVVVPPPSVIAPSTFADAVVVPVLPTVRTPTGMPVVVAPTVFFPSVTLLLTMSWPEPLTSSVPEEVPLPAAPPASPRITSLASTMPAS